MNANNSTKYKVLLVEDDPMLYRVLSMRLTESGLDVSVATDGEMALTMTRELNPDLILLDIILPKLSGFEVLSALRKEARFEKTPVVVLSNLGNESDIQQMRDLGIKEYLIKADYALSEMVRKVMSHLE